MLPKTMYCLAQQQALSGNPEKGNKSGVLLSKSLWEACVKQIHQEEDRESL